MFARFFEITAKPGKKQEFFKTLKEEILPILNKYEIIDLIPLEPKTGAARIIGEAKRRSRSMRTKHTPRSGPFWSHSSSSTRTRNSTR